MNPPAPASGADSSLSSSEYTSSEMLATLGVSREQFGRHQEQMRRSFLSHDSCTLPPSQVHSYQSLSLPFPLNLPPSYPVYASASSSTPPTRHPRPPQLRQSASFTSSHTPKKAEVGAEDHARAPITPSASSSKGKGKGTLDAFMDSRQSGQVHDPESSGSDSDTLLRKV
jgi:hypothetical protein